MPDCWIALGGNLGPVRQTFGDALDLLRSAPGVSVRGVSSIHQTRPVGAAAGSEYANAAAALETDLDPLALLDLLQSIENRLGRVRETHWGPRTLDLDLLLYGSETIDLPRLTVPHPHLWYRRFVLDPLVEVAPQVVHPVTGLTIEALRNRLLARPLTCTLAGASKPLRDGLIREVGPRFPEVEFGEEREPTLLVWLGPSDDALAGDSGRLEFSKLPLVPRLDIGLLGGPNAAALESVLRAALG